MNDQLFEQEEIVEIDGHKFVCTYVTYRERDGKKENFAYSFRPLADIEAERGEISNNESEGEE